MLERPFMPHMPDGALPLTYVLLAFSLVIFARGINELLKDLGVGTPRLFATALEKMRSDDGPRGMELVKLLLIRRNSRDNGLPFFFHSLILFSFIVLLIGTAFVALDVDVLKHFSDFRFLRGRAYLAFETILDTAGIALLTGLAVALYRRLITKPSHVHSGGSDYAVLGLLLVIAVTGFAVEAFRINLMQPPHAGYSYVGAFVESSLLANIDAGKSLQIYRFLWGVHLIAALSFIALIPYSKLKHFLLIPINFILANPGGQTAKAKLSTPFNILEMDEEDGTGTEALEQVGVGAVKDLQWEERLQISGCINCGRCESVCPAHASGRRLSPRNVIQNMGGAIACPDKSMRLVDRVVRGEEMWGCVNCYACVEACPAYIGHVNHFLNLRRSIVNDRFEDDAKISVFENVDRNGNPYGLPSYERMEWLSELDVPTVDTVEEFEYLYFIGCSSCYDQRCQEIAKALIRLLQAAGVSFAVLGEEERCCGEPAKRMGEEGLFQMTAVQNIELFATYGVQKILVHCPHCYNVLKHEYKDFNGDYQVIHHSQLIASLINSGALAVSSPDTHQIISYHDPCNLGRLNGVFDEPRSVLREMAYVKEMERSREDSFCCGGGGGNAFYKVEEKTRISHLRFQQALGSSILATACPFCMTMLEDAGSSMNPDVPAPKVLDIAEIVLKHLRE